MSEAIAGRAQMNQTNDRMHRDNEKILLIISAIFVVILGYMLHQTRTMALIFQGIFMVLLMHWLWKTNRPTMDIVFGFHSCSWKWLLVGIVPGIGLALLFRWHQSDSILLSTAKPLLLMAVLIGLTEELIFRGYFFGRFQFWLGPVWAIVISASLHTSYKVAMFATTPSVNLVFLGSLTLIVGLLLGYGRNLSGSLWPCVVFHGAFDLWVYGDKATPWWVW